MNNMRLTFNTSTNFVLSVDAFRILECDANCFGYMKNGKANISGFLNDLLPELACYQNNLYKQLLLYNNGNVEAAQIAARSIHNVYIPMTAFHEDGVAKISFRISKDKYDEFIDIHDNRLSFYDTGFTTYIRTLLVEYASKSYSQREYLYSYRRVIHVSDAIQRQNICKFYSSDSILSFVPVSIETTPILGHNYIIGVSRDGTPISVGLRSLKKVVATDEKKSISVEICDSLNDYLYDLYREEHEACLD